MSSNENNPLLQSAHLRNKNYATQSTQNTYRHDPERNVATNTDNNFPQPEDEEGFCSKNCSFFNIMMLLCTTFMLILIIALLFIYH
jgi:hypothetical protein